MKGKSPAPPSYVANDSVEVPFTQFVSVPQTPGYSDRTALERTDPFEAAIESDDALCLSHHHQIESRGATVPNHYIFVDNSDNSDAAFNVRQQSKSSGMPLQPGDDATVRSPLQDGELSKTLSDNAQGYLGCSQRRHAVGPGAQPFGETHCGDTTINNAE